jgi:hypothetical protein
MMAIVLLRRLQLKEHHEEKNVDPWSSPLEQCPGASEKPVADFRSGTRVHQMVLVVMPPAGATRMPTQE